MTDHRYRMLKAATEGVPMPSMFVDLNAFDENAKNIIQHVRMAGMKLRPATKSIRVPELLLRLQELAGETLSGFMVFSCREALVLFRDFRIDRLLVAYPTTRTEELEAAFQLIKNGADVTLMVDHPSHVEALDDFFRKKNCVVKLAIDVDMSLRMLRGRVHLGVQRSSVRSLDDFVRLHKQIKRCSHVVLKGVMGYEAQVAGLPDRNPFSFFLVNWIKQLIRWRSVKEMARKRREVFQYLKGQNVELDFFNGGGTGSLSYALNESWLTEVTAGSGFFQSHLFDYYSNWDAGPSLFFSLPVTRMPGPGIVTCKSGGFIASGEASRDKLPLPWLPTGASLFSGEGCGEVQTPVRFKKTASPSLGAPIFFRPAKAGEIAEHFNSYYLLSKNKIVGEMKTYRGLGHSFY